MRNIKLKAVRESWSHSKFFIGKNRVLRKALGDSEEEEYAEGLSMLAKCLRYGPSGYCLLSKQPFQGVIPLILRNECGLLATNQSQEEVQNYFDKLAEPDFARFVCLLVCIFIIVQNWRSGHRDRSPRRGTSA